MKPLPILNGACFQAVSDEALLGVNTSQNQFHWQAKIQRGFFVINREKNTVRPIVQFQHHRADPSQKRRPQCKFRRCTSSRKGGPRLNRPCRRQHLERRIDTTMSAGKTRRPNKASWPLLTFKRQPWFHCFFILRF